MENPLEYVRQHPQLAKQLIGLNLPEERKLNQTSDRLRCQSSWAPGMTRISHQDILIRYNPCLVKFKQNKGFNSV